MKKALQDFINEHGVLGFTLGFAFLVGLGLWLHYFLKVMGV